MKKPTMLIFIFLIFILTSCKDKEKEAHYKLLKAIETNDKASVKRLISEGAKVNGFKGFTTQPVIYAQNDKEMIQILVDAGADINSEDYVEGSLLYKHAEKADIDFLKFLIDLGAKPGLCKHKCPVINLATNDKHYDKIKLLIENGANLKFKDSINKQTALHLAAKFGAVKNIKLLIENGADIREKCKLNQTPLRYAKHGNSKEAVAIIEKALEEKK